MNEILDTFRSEKFISKIDLKSAYLQIPLEQNSKPTKAFTVPGKGMYQFKRMPFGLTNAPAAFQRLMDKVITPDLQPNVFCNLDDIIIVTQNFDDHLKYLSLVLDKIEKANLTIGLDICESGCSEIKYLGFKVNERGLQIDDDKIQPILELPTPKNIKQLQRLIGMESWYRKFIPYFDEIIESLNRLLKKNKKWEWETEQIEAFEKIKEHLTSAPILTCPDFSQPFQLETDASDTELGAVLNQTINGTNHVIAYASRNLNSAETRYSALEKECLAVVWAIRKFRPYLEGYSFKVITDHMALKWLHNLKNPMGRLATWALELLEFDYEVVYRKGSSNLVPDALSRSNEATKTIVFALACSREKPKVEVEDETYDWYSTKMRQVRKKPEDHEKWRIRDSQLYFFRPDLLKSSLLPEVNPWKLVLPKRLRAHCFQENEHTPKVLVVPKRGGGGDHVGPRQELPGTQMGGTTQGESARGRKRREEERKEQRRRSRERRSSRESRRSGGS